MKWEPYALRPGSRAEVMIHLGARGTVVLEGIDMELVGSKPNYSMTGGAQNRVVEPVDLEGVHEAREELADGESCTVTSTVEIPSEPERLHGQHNVPSWRLRVAVDPFDAGQVHRDRKLSVDTSDLPEM